MQPVDARVGKESAILLLKSPLLSEETRVKEVIRKLLEQNVCTKQELISSLGFEWWWDRGPLLGRVLGLSEAEYKEAMKPVKERKAELRNYPYCRILLEREIHASLRNRQEER